MKVAIRNTQESFHGIGIGNLSQVKGDYTNIVFEKAGVEQKLLGSYLAGLSKTSDNSFLGTEHR